MDYIEFNVAGSPAGEESEQGGEAEQEDDGDGPG